REDSVFHAPRPGGLDGAVLGPEAFVLRFFSEKDNDRLLIINLGTAINLTTFCEPLLAPVEGSGWKIIWSSEDPRYGGSGTQPLVEGNWRICGHAALVLAPDRL